MSSRHHRPNCHHEIMPNRCDNTPWMTKLCTALCWVFCCPPLPSKITGKLAFFPPERSYTFYKRCNLTHRYKIRFNQRAGCSLARKEIVKIAQGFRVESLSGTKVACVFLPVHEKAPFTLMLAHANACDVGHVIEGAYLLAKKTGVNMMLYDYSGYGESTGLPSEKNLYLDTHSAYIALKKFYGLRDHEILLMGQSIGTVAVIELACRLPNLAGLILEAPLLSGLKVIGCCPRGELGCPWPCVDTLDSEKRMPHVECPVLIIHGTHDDVVLPFHGKRLYRICPNPVQPLFIDGAGHSDLSSYYMYYERIFQFIHSDIVSSDYSGQSELSVQLSHTTNDSSCDVAKSIDPTRLHSDLIKRPHQEGSVRPQLTTFFIDTNLMSRRDRDQALTLFQDTQRKRLSPYYSRNRYSKSASAPDLSNIPPYTEENISSSGEGTFTSRLRRRFGDKDCEYSTVLMNIEDVISNPEVSRNEHV